MENRVGVGTITADRPALSLVLDPLLKRRRGCPVLGGRGRPRRWLCMIRVAAVAAVTGSGLSCPERPPSTPNLVRCYHESRFPVNEKLPFWNSGGSRRVLVAIIGGWREQRTAKFIIRCLFTVIHCSLWRGKSRSSVILEAAGGCAESSVARHLFRKNSLLKSLINSLFREHQ